MNIVQTLKAGSGIDTAKLVRDLVAAQRTPQIKRLRSRGDILGARISGLSQLRAGLQAFSAALSRLTESGVLGVQARSSNSAVASLSVLRPDAPPTSLDVEVRALARRQSLASQPIADPNASLGGGTLTINFGKLTTGNGDSFSALDTSGARRSVDIRIESAAATPDGIARAINAADAGLTASVLNIGGRSRLIIKGADGAASGFSVSVNADTPGAALEGLRYDATASTMALTGAASDADLVVEGVAVTRPTNRINDLIDGFAVDLSKAEVGTKVTLSAAYDVAQLRTATGNLVAAYNELQRLLDKVAAPGTGGAAGGPLQNSSAVRELRRELRALTTQPLLAGGDRTTLASIGVRSNRNGRLTLDARTLAAALRDAPQDIGKLFLDTRQTSSGAIDFADSASQVTPGTYQLSNVTAATSGTLTGTAVASAFTAPVVISAANQALKIAIDGRESLTINIAAGSYASGADLAGAIAAGISSDALLGKLGKSARVSWTGSAFVLSSATPGAQSSVAITQIDATLSTRLGLAGAVSAPGVDAAGEIGGVAANASGDVLSAPSGTAADGLRIRVTADVATASVSVAHGLNTRLRQISGRLTGARGAFSLGIAQIQRQQRQIGAEQARIDARSAALEKQLGRQFRAMEVLVTQFQSTQTFLKQQIDIWTQAKR